MNWSWFKARLVYYPTLAWNIALGRILKVRNWWDEIDETVVIGAMPFSSDVEALAKIGITGVVNTCQEYAGPTKEYEACKIEQFRMPTIDFTHPKLEHVTQAVKFIKSQQEKGGRVYVHCKAGRARSATVVVCWLIRYAGMNRHEAQALLLQKRPHANPRIAERDVVIEFEKQFLKTA